LERDAFVQRAVLAGFVHCFARDNTKKVTPISEITQFPSVLVLLDGRKSRRIDEFDTFVRSV
jgi:hypothetical protein